MTKVVLHKIAGFMFALNVACFAAGLYFVLKGASGEWFLGLALNGAALAFHIVRIRQKSYRDV